MIKSILKIYLIINHVTNGWIMHLASNNAFIFLFLIQIKKTCLNRRNVAIKGFEFFRYIYFFNDKYSQIITLVIILKS